MVSERPQNRYNLPAELAFLSVLIGFGFSIAAQEQDRLLYWWSGLGFLIFGLILSSVGFWNIGRSHGDVGGRILCRFALGIGILGLLSGMWPLVQENPVYHDLYQARSNFQQVADALEAYEHVHGVLPPAYSVDAQGRPLHSWRVLILPYLGREETRRFEKIRLDEPWDSPHNRTFWNQRPDVYKPSQGDHGPDVTFTQVYTGPGGVFEPPGGHALSDIKDRPDQTILVTSGPRPIVWMAPRDIAKRPDHGPSELGGEHNPRPDTVFHHADGCLMLLADFRVEYWHRGKLGNLRTVRAALTRDGAENSGQDPY